MSENPIIGDTACPKCRESGGDKTGNHLILFQNGAGFCNRCGYKEPPETFTKPSSNSLTGEKTDEQVEQEIQEIEENSTIKGIADRGLKRFACDYYGVRTGLSLSDGTTPVCYYLPRVNVDGEKIGYKCKPVSGNPFNKGRGRGAAFWGADKVPKRGKKIFITEGELDAVALYQSIYEHIDSRFQKNISVVSLPDGAGSAASAMSRNAEMLMRFKEIVLCFDMDKAGQDAVKAALTVLPKEKVKVAQYPLKDANDMVKAGNGRDLYFSVMQANAPRPEKILPGSALTMEDLMTPLRKGIMTPFPGLNSKTRGLRFGSGGGELTVICAGTGMGKTTLAREIAYSMNKNDKLRLGNIYLEEDKRKTGQSYIALDNNVPLAELRMDPTIIAPSDFRRSYDELINNGRVFVMDHWGSLASSELMDHMHYMSKVEKCDFIFLDHISLVISGQDSKEGERKDLDILMTKLAAFTEESGTSTVAIVHLKRPDNGSFNDGRSINLTHLRGSAAIEQLSHNIIAVEGNQHGANPNERIIRVLKNREWGDLGEADRALYDPDTGRLTPQEYGSIGLTGS